MHTRASWLQDSKYADTTIFVVSPVTTRIVVVAVTIYFDVTVIVTTKLVGCYIQVDHNIYHLFHVIDQSVFSQH